MTRSQHWSRADFQRRWEEAVARGHRGLPIVMDPPASRTVLLSHEPNAVIVDTRRKA